MGKEEEISGDKYDSASGHQLSFEEYQAKEEAKNNPLLAKPKDPKAKSRWQKKRERILGAAGDMRNKFILGFKLGGIIGGTFGTVIGAYYSFAYRSLIYLPAFAISSGMSFGFFMAIGTIVRSDSLSPSSVEQDQQFVKVFKNEEGKWQVSRESRYVE